MVSMKMSPIRFKYLNILSPVCGAVLGDLRMCGYAGGSMPLGSGFESAEVSLDFESLSASCACLKVEALCFLLWPPPPTMTSLPLWTIVLELEAQILSPSISCLGHSVIS